MGAKDHKVGAPIRIWQVMGDVFINQASNLKIWWDEVGETVRVKHDSLCDYIDSNIATKDELRGVPLGQIPDGTLTKAKMATALQLEMSRYRPVGSVVTMATQMVPDGYLECDGSAVSRATYSDLFAAIGVVFGVGDGSTTFNLPDLRGEFVRGWDHGKGSDSGRVFGSAQAATQVSQNGPVRNGEPPTFQESISDGYTTGGSTAYSIRPRNIALMYCIKF